MCVCGLEILKIVHRRCNPERTSSIFDVTTTFRAHAKVANMSAFRAVSMLRLSRTAVAQPAVRSMSTVSAGRSLALQAPKPFIVQRRGYAASSGLSSQEIQNRIFDVLKSFEKVEPSKVSLICDRFVEKASR